MGIRRLGYLGASLRYVSERVPVIVGRPAADLRVVACHLGGSSSVCAIRGGVSIDTSMGMSTQAGVPMSDRCGDVDPFVLLYAMDRYGLDTDGARAILAKKGGLAGISGVGGDVRDLEEAAGKGNRRAELALDVFAYSVKKYIGPMPPRLAAWTPWYLPGHWRERRRHAQAHLRGPGFSGNCARRHQEPDAWQGSRHRDAGCARQGSGDTDR